MARNKNRICAVADDSIAQELGIETGDYLISINHTPVIDVFDYRMRTTVSELIIEIEKLSGEKIEFDIEKDEYDDIGIDFDLALMDENKTCQNKCVFCFIDQLPPNMRESLYFKDDDLRLSFLTGNYVTLTNLSDKELDRLISYRLSPMNISVHTTNPSLRIKMMKNKRAGDILSQLKKIASSGISINCQIVLCPGINDSDELLKTLNDLFEIGEAILSVAVVPVGVTKFRSANKVEHIQQYDQVSAKRVIELITTYQKQIMQNSDHQLLFASDEFYIKAGLPFPSLSEYADLPQIENGVGMVPLFLYDMQQGIIDRNKRNKKVQTNTDSGNDITMNRNNININNTKNNNTNNNINNADNNNFNGNDSDNKFYAANTQKVLIITGVDAMPYIQKFADDLSKLYKRQFAVKAISNRFFGESVTVTGLVTGFDIVSEIGNRDFIKEYDLLILPDCMLRAGENVFLDDITVDDLKEILKIPIICTDSTASGFLETLDKVFI